MPPPACQHALVSASVFGMLGPLSREYAQRREVNLQIDTIRVYHQSTVGQALWCAGVLGQLVALDSRCTTVGWRAFHTSQVHLTTGRLPNGVRWNWWGWLWSADLTSKVVRRTSWFANVLFGPRPRRGQSWLDWHRCSLQAARWCVWKRDRTSFSQSIMSHGLGRWKAGLRRHESAFGWMDARAAHVASCRILPRPETSQEGHIGLFVYLPVAMGQSFEPYLMEVLTALLDAQEDDTTSVRDIAFRAGQVLIKHFGASHTALLLTPLEDGVLNADWRIRHASVQLMGQLWACEWGARSREGLSMEIVARSSKAGSPRALALPGWASQGSKLDELRCPWRQLLRRCRSSGDRACRVRPGRLGTSVLGSATSKGCWRHRTRSSSELREAKSCQIAGDPPIALRAHVPDPPLAGPRGVARTRTREKLSKSMNKQISRMSEALGGALLSRENALCRPGLCPETQSLLQTRQRLTSSGQFSSIGLPSLTAVSQTLTQDA